MEGCSDVIKADRTRLCLRHHELTGQGHRQHTDRDTDGDIDRDSGSLSH